MRIFLSWLLFGMCCTAGDGFGSEKAVLSDPYVIILYGSPGSGKASIAARLRVDFGLPVISPVTHLSSHVLEETPLGNKAKDFFSNGSPMPKDLLPALLCDRLLESDCCQGALLEDTPLSLEQVQALHECMSPRFHFLVVGIDASDEWILRKAEHRAICHQCGKVFDVPQEESRRDCDICNTPLTHRKADSPETMRAKIKEYNEAVAPLFEWYHHEGVLIRISGEKKFDVVYEEVVDSIEKATGLMSEKSRHPIIEE